MRTEAADGGGFTSKVWHDKDYPRIRIRFSLLAEPHLLSA
jgi:hypothetical protein